MNCPSCNGVLMRVVFTRMTSGESIVRRRKCRVCDYGWYTVELPIPNHAVIHTKDTTTNVSGLNLHKDYKNITFQP